MKGLDYTTAIKEAAAELQALYYRQKRPLARRRLRFLIILKTGVCSSQARAGEQISIKQRASEKLWRLYQLKGIVGLLERPRSGQPPKLDQRAKEALQNQLDSDRVQTLQQACDFVYTSQGITISTTAMHQYFKAQGIKKKTGRPSSVRKDVLGEARFKKKSFLA